MTWVLSVTLSSPDFSTWMTPSREPSTLYPRTLNLTPSSPAGARSVPYLDLRLTFQVRAPPTGLVPRFPLLPAPYIKAGLYDKRDGPRFVVLRLSRFIPLSSNVDPACKQNIMIGQAARLAVLCSEWWEFAQNMAAIILILVSRGYIVDDCFQRLKRWLYRRPDVFYGMGDRVASIMQLPPPCSGPSPQGNSALSVRFFRFFRV